MIGETKSVTENLHSLSMWTQNAYCLKLTCLATFVNFSIEKVHGIYMCKIVNSISSPHIYMDLRGIILQSHVDLHALIS